VLGCIFKATCVLAASVVSRLGRKTEPEVQTRENPNPNIPKTELPNYISGSKFQNLNTFRVITNGTQTTQITQTIQITQINID
jgi:hypothetical protein